MSIRTILHPTDFSDCSRYAFRLAGMLAREEGARLVVLHVKPTMGPHVAYESMLAQLEPEGSQQKLSDLLYRLRVPDPNVQVEHRLIEGQGAEEILQVATEVGADLIVMGTHGRTGLGQLLMGSIAGEVVRNATCPVVTVKIPNPIHSNPRSATGQLEGKKAATTAM